MTITDDTGTAAATRTAYRGCTLCEAVCGLEITVAGDRVTRIRGDRDDVFSHGYICPKGSTMRQLHEDPDRLRQPMVKRDGKFVPVSWDEAFAEVERRLVPLLDEHGRDAVAVYLGNPNVHMLAGLLFLRPLIKALGTTNVYSASTVDQRPKEISSGLMFGSAASIAVPDIDRTDYLVMLGANPYASNGSLATAPDWPGRIEALLARGGKLVVVDPRRSRTAQEASEHLAVVPGTDAFLLMSMVHVLAADGLVDLGPLADYTNGVAEVLALAESFAPEVTAPVTGIDAATVRRIVHELAAAPSGCVYGRMGTTTAEFGTLASWLIDVINVLTGNLDRPGGAMFPTGAAGAANTRGTPRYGRGLKIHRRRSRVRGAGESLGELPVACLAEEIDTPGDGQVRALVTVAGNPVLSTPNAGRLDAALAGLDFYVAVDVYINETTRHADVILPGPSALQRGHYDLAFLQLAIRNVARWSAPVLSRDQGHPEEWEVLARLALIAQGMGATADPALVDDLVLQTLVGGAVADDTSPIAGRDPAEIVASLGDRRGPERLVDFLLRSGPYGDGFGKPAPLASRTPDGAGLSLDLLEAHPHGVDLWALEPRIPDVLRTPTGMIELAPEPIVADVARLRDGLSHRTSANGNGMVLVGRRDLRSNNSWGHNVEVLVKGKPRCTLHIHPDDAARLGVTDGGDAQVASRTGTVTIPVEVTNDIRPGVVSIPHGWGHDMDGVELSVARRYAGVNSNLLADEHLVDALSGTTVLNGIPITVTPA